MRHGAMAIAGIGLVVATCLIIACFVDFDHIKSDKTTQSTDTVLQSVQNIWSEYCDTFDSPSQFVDIGAKIISAQFEALELDKEWLEEHRQSIENLARSQFCETIKVSDYSKIPFIGLCLRTSYHQSTDFNARSIEQHNEAVNILIDCLSKNLRSCIADRDGFDQLIYQEVERARQVMEKKLDELRQSPLYPGFRRPWSESDWKAVEKRALDRVTTTPFRFQSGSEAELRNKYAKMLRMQANTEVKSHLEFISFLDIVPFIDHPEVTNQFFWSTDNQKSLMFDGSGRWPIIVSLRPRNSQ